ncbi:hypothetical protein HY029_00660 [Candidatus Gottesmanbacteria bacterium]|nr:hypothetical protein [Candidatus Gottesmanbacteria bacterium]
MSWRRGLEIGSEIGIAFALMGCARSANIFPTQTIASQDRTPTITPVNKNLIPPPLPTRTLIYPTATVLPTPTEILRPNLKNLQMGVGTSSEEFISSEVLTENGCKLIYSPDGICFEIGFPDMDVDFAREEFENGLVPSFYPEKPQRLRLIFGVDKKLANMNPAKERIEVIPNPGDENKTSIAADYFKLIDFLLNDLYYKGVLIEYILPYPSNSEDVGFRKLMEDRQRRLVKVLQDHYARNKFVVFVDPTKILLRYRDKFDLSHLTKDAYYDLMQYAKFVGDERMRQEFPTPIYIVPTRTPPVRIR